MIHIKDRRKCCGCGACAQICPKGCVRMEEDAEGFLYPVADADQCAQCGLCETVCPLRKPSGAQNVTVEAYAAYAKNQEIREESSSGGIFSLLAKEILAQNGVVFGAAFDDGFLVHHIKAEQAHQLQQLRGSKYLQSRTENTFAEAKASLKAGRTVLYAGTPCQIAGLKSYLGREYENLYTADILCHGVPSSRLWKNYVKLQEEAHGAEICGVSFRKKTAGWKHYSVELKFRNGMVYSSVFTEDPYMRAFLADVCLRPSCHACQFKSIPHGADITIGDAWGVGKILPDMDDDRGTSVVIINSQQGQKLWERIVTEMECGGANIDRLVRRKSDARKPVAVHPGRKRFFRAVEAGASLEELDRIAQRRPLRKLIAKGKKMVKKLLRKV